MDNESITDLVVSPRHAVKLNKSKYPPAITRPVYWQGGPVPHIGVADVKLLAEEAYKQARGCNKERDKLLIFTLFDPALRVSEAINLTPRDIKRQGDGWYLDILGKGKRYRRAAISASLVAELQAYFYRRSIAMESRIFNINRARVFQIVDRAADAINLPRPKHVGVVHLLRHSGAIERLRQTGNPRSIQEQLGHSTIGMTLRYLKTLSAEEALEIQAQVDFQW